MLTDSLFQKKIATQIILTYPCLSATSSNTVITFTNKTNHPQIFTLNNYINKKIHKHKTNTWKQQDKIYLKHNLTSLPQQIYPTKSYTQNKRKASALDLKEPLLT